MRFPLIVAASLALAACSADPSGTAEQAEEDTMDFSVDEQTGETRSTITTQDGTATMQSGPNVQARLPLGFDVYPGASVVSVTNIDSNGERGSLVTLESSDTPDKIAEYYSTKAESAGLGIAMDLKAGTSRSLAGEGPGGASFSLHAVEKGSATDVQLMVSEGPGA